MDRSPNTWSSPLVCQWWAVDPFEVLPHGWQAELFKIVEGGHGRVGIYGPWAKQCPRSQRIQLAAEVHANARP